MQSHTFLSTLSLRRATPFATSAAVALPISIHALLAENDQAGLGMSTRLLYFYPRSPCGERRHWQTGHRRTRHFYPRSPCGERRAIGRRGRAVRDISIHALLAESDCTVAVDAIVLRDFYPRSPCGERLMPFVRRQWLKKFLSTLSLRRATPKKWPKSSTPGNFYPRSPCGERRALSFGRRHSKVFLSTLSLRRATILPGAVLPLQDFYPRSPCGERPLRAAAVPSSI